MGVGADDAFAACSEDRRVETEFRSGDALFVFDDERRILSWNPAAEALTGIAAADAVGKRCWDVVGGLDERGSLVCHPGCSGARLATEGWPVHCQQLLVKTASGSRRRVMVSTISVRNGDRPLYLHLLRNGEEVEAESPDDAQAGRRPALTRRQLGVLELIDQGHSAKAIAERLRIAEPTVRNHIRAILLEFGCHSQLEALAAARRLGML
ncbi:MAG: LuxR C-terminal-related transcriptional regulator [Verrucomicrobiota bacterium]